MKTELIMTNRLVVTKKGERYVVVTQSGVEVWVPKNQFDTSAEQISYVVRKAGDTITLTKDFTKDGKTYVKGDSYTLLTDRIEFAGCGKQTVKKMGTEEIINLLVSKGITPTFALA